MKNVLLLLSSGFEMFEASAFIDVIGWNLEYGDKSTSLHTCGLTSSVKSTFGQTVEPNILLADVNVDDYDALAIPGGFGTYGFYKEAYSASFFELIKEFNSKGKWIFTICVAALPLGKSGILNGKQATSYNMMGKKRQIELNSYGATIVDKKIVEDGNTITSMNPSTAIHVAFLLLEKLTTKENTDYIRRIMGYID